MSGTTGHTVIGHAHRHGRDCGHTAVPHGDHVDYLHDGHSHHAHGGHYDECDIEQQGEASAHRQAAAGER